MLIREGRFGDPTSSKEDMGIASQAVGNFLKNEGRFIILIENIGVAPPPRDPGFHFESTFILLNLEFLSLRTNKRSRADRGIGAGLRLPPFHSLLNTDPAGGLGRKPWLSLPKTHE